MNTRKSILSQSIRYFSECNNKSIIPGKDLIPPSGKLLYPQDLSNLIDSCLDLWFTSGRYTKKFEQELARYMNQKYSLMVNSGSSANLIAFSSLTSPLLKERQINKGDEVISVAAGFPTTINPILQCGCVPVFVDINKETLNIDIQLIEGAITKKTKAVFLAHTLGNPYEIIEVKRLCDKYNLWLIEDCCDALGALYDRDKKVGEYSDLCTLSFYPAHHITTGEGGAVLTSNPVLKKIAESFRDWGRDCWCPPGKDNTCGKRFDQDLIELPEGYDHKYIYSHLGYNLKPTDMQAALGLSQLEHVDEFIHKRILNYNQMKSNLEEIEGQISFAKPEKNCTPSWFGFPITLAPHISRKNVINKLNTMKIGTRLIFAGNVTKQPYMRNQKYKIFGELKNTDIIMNNSFWTGVYPALNSEHMNYISETLKNILRDIK